MSSVNAQAGTGDALRQSARLSPDPRQRGVTNTSNKQTNKQDKKMGKEEGKEGKGRKSPCSLQLETSLEAPEEAR